MHTFVDRLDRFLSDNHNEVVLALALVVLAQAVIIWLWARRADTLRRRLDAAGEAAGSAATHAAAALAVDGLRADERDLEAPAVQPVAPAPAAPAAWAPATPAAWAPAAVAAPAAAAAPEPDTFAAASLSPVETAAALRAAAEAGQPPAAPAGMADWAVEAAAQLTPAPVTPAPAAERPAAGLGGVAAWTETRPLGESSPAWTWTTPATASAAQAAGALAATPGGPVKLLLVEDDANVAKLYRMLLESRGYIVRHAADGVEGLEAARSERPDLILLDVMMPRMNGISFLQALREDATLGAVPAVVLSNFREPRLVERAMALGALEYMVKAQTRPETLVGAIPHWLKGERVVTA
jgi:CheY-like chemotaxis protein